jgi:putative membrane protein
MYLQQILLGLIELLISIFISFVLIAGSYRFFIFITPRFDEERQLKKKNTAVGVVLGGILIGEVLVVKQAIYPVMSVIQLFILGEDKNFANYMEMLGLSLGYVLLAGIIALGCILFSFWAFNKITPRIDQYQEIRNNNVAVAVFMALFIVGICILISDGVSGLTKALIPFPEIGSIPLK